MTRVFAVVLAVLLSGSSIARADDGYDLWLRYRLIDDRVTLAAYRGDVARLIVGGSSPTMRAVREELSVALSGLLGAAVPLGDAVARDGSVIFGTPGTLPIVATLPFVADREALGADGYIVRATSVNGRRVIAVVANTDIGVLYGTFAFLRQMQRTAA